VRNIATDERILELFDVPNVLVSNPLHIGTWMILFMKQKFDPPILVSA
jgi:hypothetical protein